ncbi:PAS domain S-box-containing protein [Halorientalis persicus]|jgi:PAS domain S-box-containing protein|uniref:PAS domain S-box-containing protein n=1 Tax=Halorientalis persicus TaxID=1367881 RepID=A0A1H8G5J5_9EURY|nr:PAS domain S-box protein [Halorientalis persicus]SEN39282.1 PAS domain S-box-containing protein [Halorientalis persicus]
MGENSYREAIYDVFADTTRATDEKVDRALDLGTEYLGLSIGFLTRIDDGAQEIVQATGDHELLQPGETCPLDEAYCRRTIETDSPLAVGDAAASPAITDTAVRTFGLGTYLGAKVVVDDAVYGTICFADRDERDVPFSEAEELFIELVAKLIGQAIERRRHERELREEKRRFEGIAETSFDVLFRIDRDGIFTYVSAAVQRVLGYEPATLVGTAFAEFLAPSAVEPAMEAYSQVLGGETVEALEVEFLDTDDAVVVLEINGTPITEDGAVVGVQGVGRDVTARRERERELRIKNRAMDEADIGISIADAREGDNSLVYVNDGFQRLTGYDEAELLGQNCRFLQGEATDPDTVATLAERIDAREPVTVEILNYRADGSPFWNRVRVSPIENGRGEVTHYLGFQDDVTERKRTERLIELLNRVLRHNLRNDMNALLLFGDQLQEGTVPDTEAMGGRIRATAERLTELSEQARRLEQYARQERLPRRLDPSTVLDDVASAVRSGHPDATVEESVRTDRGICAGAELERAITELVENALKHDPAPEPRVAVDAVDDDEWIEITVTDDGAGISEQETAMITQGEETALEHGSGLGLWLVNWIVTRYGGSFQVRPREADDGTVATVRVPAIADDQSIEDVARPPTVLFR